MPRIYGYAPYRGDPMGRKIVAEARRGERARLELTVAPELKQALAHAAIERGVTVAQLVEEIVRGDPLVQKYLPQGLDSQNG